MSAELTREQKIDAAVRRLILYLGPTDAKLLGQWVAIPNRPDCTPYVIDLQEREGAERVRRVSEMLEAMRQELEVRYDAIQPVVQQLLGVTELA